MYHQVKLAIVPKLTLEETIKDWAMICALLAERKRKRKNQMNKAFLI
jgi:hypothetical protein